MLGFSGDPSKDCTACARLVRYRLECRNKQPDWHNGAVATFGDPAARLLIVGLAPGLQGANRTGRPFTGDHAGDLLYATLDRLGLSRGRYDRDGQDDYALTGCAITNAVRCVPPANKPETSEIANCNKHLEAVLKGLPQVCSILALGSIAHAAVLTALGLKRSAFAFAHGARYEVVSAKGRTAALIDSYHCSRLNTNTGRLTPQMFEAVVSAARQAAGL